MTKKVIIFLSFIFFYFQSHAQAGYGVYQFLNLPVSSRMAAMGGTNVSLQDNDLNFAFQNPALLSNETSNIIGLNMANYLADIKFGSAIYGHSIDSVNYIGVGVQYVDYGTFKQTTDLNQILGEFTAKDMALNLIYTRRLTKNISVGATIKPVYSAYETYTSFGMAADLGVNYNDPKALFSAGLVLRNMGTQFKGYYSDQNGQHFEPLPFDIQAGVSKKLTHAPLRFSFTLHDLQQWDLSYQSTNQPVQTFTTTTSTSTPTNSISFVDMAFRHTIIAIEFVPTKNFYLTAAYNHRREQEMSMSGFKSMAGFSFGGGIKIYKFHVGFGMTQFQVGNYSYQFSISTSLNEFRL
jgi:hypothetical protein